MVTPVVLVDTPAMEVGGVNDCTAMAASMILRRRRRSGHDNYRAQVLKITGHPSPAFFLRPAAAPVPVAPLRPHAYTLSCWWHSPHLCER